METIETPKFTNPDGYPEVDADRLHPVGDWILLQWEQATDEIKAGKIKLIRPATFKKQHYTGIVHAAGSWVDPDIQPGMRLFFEQFSGFQKMFDPKYGRMAMIRESFALVALPPRVKVESMDGEYDYAS